jgi:steroid delta-isomerase-like uncharacterized protein
MTNAELTRRWFHEVWTQGKESTIDSLASPDLVAYGLGTHDQDVHGTEQFKVFWKNLRTVFPDIEIEVVDTVSEGDKVACRVQMKGTHLGPGLAKHFDPTGKSIDIEGICILRWKDGKVVEGWNLWDQFGMIAQISPKPMTLNLVE